MHTNQSKAKKALTFLLIFAMIFTFLVASGGGFGKKEDWRAYAADAANAKYSLAGAVYKVYTNQACTSQAYDANGNLAQFTTGANGEATSELEMDEGTYYVKESKASTGYTLDTTVYKVVVKSGETTWVNSNRVLETPQSVDIKIVKKSDNKEWNGWPIKDAKFKITYTDGAQVTRNWIVKTDANGVATLDDAHFVSGDARYKNSKNKYVVPIGKVTVKEIDAPMGYLINDATKTVNISWGGSTETKEDAVTITGDINANREIVVAETSTAGKLMSLKKVDTTGENGWRKLLDAEYTLKYYRVNPETTTDVSGMTPEKSWTFKTREMGSGIDKSAGIDFQVDEPVSGDEFWTEYVINNTADGTIEISTPTNPDAVEMRILPVGVFTIEETKSPPGLRRNKTIYYGKVTQDPSGTRAKTVMRDTDGMIVVDYGELANAEEPSRVVIKIDKKNARTGESAATESEDSHSEGRQGAYSTLAGAKYEVYLDTEDVSKPELVGIITTDENGKGELQKRTHGRESHIGQDLPLGDYIIVETTPSPGFVIDKYEYKDGKQVEVKDGPIEVICGYEDDGDTPVTKTIEGSRKDGKHVFSVKMEEPGVSEFTATVSSLDEPTRTYIKKTDATTTKELPGATLQILDSDGELVEEWVSTEEDHLVNELPAGTYTLREITAPYGYDVAEDIEFTIEEGKIVTNVEMKNKPIEVGTTATDAETETHQGTFSETQEIVDVVKLSGLTEGRKYKVKGSLYNKTTGEPLKDNEGHVYEAESDEFTATGDRAEVTLTFTVDSSQFEKDMTVVAFEKLFRTAAVHGEAVPVELAKHEDPDDEEQTIHYGGIVGTTATDQDEISKNILAGKKTVIVDVVEYKNLSTKETYKLEGELYDKTTGRRTGIKATTKFKPETASGKVKVTFKFDSTAYAGHDLVVYESLFLKTGLLSDDVLIDKHEDPEDEDQTVEVTDYKMYKVRNEEASGSGNKYGFEPGDVVTYDVVIKNISSRASLRMDVSDKFVEHPEYFSTPKVIDVKNAKVNSKSSNGNKVNITIKAGDTAVVTYAAVIDKNAKAYLAKAAKDSDSLDKDGKDCNRKERTNRPDEHDGYRNEASTTGVTPHDPDDPDKPYKPLDPKDDDAQTPVRKPEIGTFLSDKAGAKEIDPSGNTVLVDTVAYSDLTPGKKYAVVGELILKDTGNPLVESGAPVKAVGIFTPRTASGSAEVQFVVNTKGLAGKELVAFETAYKVDGIDDTELKTPADVEKNGFPVAEHKDLRDKAQTVYIKAPGQPHAPKTGEDFMIFFLGAAFVLLTALAVTVTTIIKRRAAARQ